MIVRKRLLWVIYKAIAHVNYALPEMGMDGRIMTGFIKPGK